MQATRWQSAVDGQGETRWLLAVGVDEAGVLVQVPVSRTVARILAPEFWVPEGAEVQVPASVTIARALAPWMGVEEDIPPVPDGVAFALWDEALEEWRVVRLEPSGHQTQLEPQAVEASRGVLGIVRSSITTIRGHLRTWELQAVEMWAEDADAVEGMLLPQLPLIAGGSIVDGQVEVVPGPPQKAIGRTTLYARISVVLYEAAPAHLEA